MTNYSIIFSQSNTNITLVEETEQERIFTPFDTISDVMAHLNEMRIVVPLSRVFAGFEAFRNNQ